MPDNNAPLSFPAVPPPDTAPPPALVPVPSAATLELKCVKIDRRNMQVQVLEENGLHACMREGALVTFDLVKPGLESHPTGTMSIEMIGNVPFEVGVHYRVEFFR